jgi:hypothetical protein
MMAATTVTGSGYGCDNGDDGGCDDGGCGIKIFFSLR